MKQCNKCGLSKELEFFHKSKGSKDGHCNTCKECARAKTKEWNNRARSDPGFREKERDLQRKRDQEKRAKGLLINRPKPYASKRLSNLKYREKYPEKYKAAIATCEMKRKDGLQIHHWSYRPEHHKDILWLSIADHNKAHRFIIYDPERSMYRRSDNNELLDTKERHETYILDCIKNKE